MVRGIILKPEGLGKQQMYKRKEVLLGGKEMKSVFTRAEISGGDVMQVRQKTEEKEGVKVQWEVLEKTGQQMLISPPKSPVTVQHSSPHTL